MKFISYFFNYSIERFLYKIAKYHLLGLIREISPASAPKIASLECIKLLAFHPMDFESLIFLFFRATFVRFILVGKFELHILGGVFENIK